MLCKEFSRSARSAFGTNVMNEAGATLKVEAVCLTPSKKTLVIEIAFEDGLALMKLMQRDPNCKVFRSVPLGLRSNCAGERGWMKVQILDVSFYIIGVASALLEPNAADSETGEPMFVAERLQPLALIYEAE